jgi:hypothetical protein
MARLDAQARLERVDEALEEIDHERVRAPHDRAHVVVHQRGEHDRAAVARLGGDARNALFGLFRAVDKRQRHLVEFDPLELGHQAVAKHLRGDAGAVGDEKHGAPVHGDKILQCG